METTTLEKLNALALDESKLWEEKADWRKANREWLNKSVKIAVRILREIRLQKATNGMSQKKLAEIMGVSPQYINKVVKGQENLSLDTICKIENALGIVLIDVPLTDRSLEVEFNSLLCSVGISRNLAQPFASDELEYCDLSSYQTSELVDA